MELDRMWDIAGCRCVLKNSNHVVKLLRLLEENLTVRKINNYYENDVESGYRSIHLYVTEIHGDNRPIEIQIRSKQDHNWATLVEIIDILYEMRLKEGQSSPDFEKFLKMIAILDNLKQTEKIILIELIHDLGIFNKLFSVFIQNYLSVRVQWLRLNKTKEDHYFVIELGSDNKPEILAFDSFKKAEEEYFRRFIINSGNNIVLTYLPQANFENLETAYANYTLTTHTFIDDYFKLIGEVCVELINRKEYKRYYNTYSHFLKHFEENFQMIISEIETINTIESSDRSKVKYWKKDFKKRIDSRLKQSRLMHQKINNIRPIDGIDSIIFSFYDRLLKSKRKKVKIFRN
jgi:ppGpp synthetase/RelA/SpoT-type nucleotidyltranferase